ncbi:calcium-binding protein [Leisingera sp. JC11]|uniref:calcium-binding protein n=1 Tax=Leisingera sp. JC11 TaxID=3042469 RepID=UPI0034570A24
MEFLILLGIGLTIGGVAVALDDDEEEAFQTQNGTEGDDLLLGNDANDHISGGEGADSIGGFGGNDLIRGEDGSDLLDGGSGADELDGGEGQDSLYGDEGDDYLHGEADPDFLAGEAGNDTLNGGGGLDFLHGGTGNDVLQGSLGADYLRGDDGNDDLDGGYGGDALHGGDGADSLEGGEGNDLLNGGDVLGRGPSFAEDVFDDLVHGLSPNSIGSESYMISDDGTGDELLGGNGQDTLIGGGDDTLTGGDGADEFVAGDWLSDGEYATVTDFIASEDMIVYRYDETAAAPNLTIVSIANPDGTNDAELRADGETVLRITDVSEDFNLEAQVALVASPMA